MPISATPRFPPAGSCATTFSMTPPSATLPAKRPRRCSIAEGTALRCVRSTIELTDRATSSHHADDLLATLAESGIPLDTPIHLRDGDATVSDLLETSLSRFHLDQLEYEWTAIAYARYVFPAAGVAQQVRRADRRRSTRRGSSSAIRSTWAPATACTGWKPWPCCTGPTNRPTLSASARSSRCCCYMKRVSMLAGRSAVDAMAIGPANGRRARRPQIPSKKNVPTLHDKLLVTGHHLEWLALAPDEVQPPRETIVRAGQWLARTLVEMEQKAAARSLRSLLTRGPRAVPVAVEGSLHCLASGQIQIPKSAARNKSPARSFSSES